MAGIFEASLITPAAAPGVAYLLIQHSGAATSPRMRLRELTWTTKAGTQSPVGLIRTATLGVPSGPVAGQACDDLENAAAKGQLAIPGTAGNAPTIAGSPVYFRQFYAAAVAGSGISWTWPVGEEITISPGGGLLLWNMDGAITGSILSASARWAE